MNEVLALLILLSVVGAIVAVVTPNLLYSVISLGAVGTDGDRIAIVTDGVDDFDTFLRLIVP